MSALLWHTPTETVRLSGSERAYMGQMTTNLALSVLDGWLSYDYEGRPSRLRSILPADCYVARTPIGDPHFRQTASTWLSVAGDEAHILYQRERYNVWEIHLNTALALGNDSVRLMARLHAQCEIYCYLNGEHRAWFASLIERGRKAHLLRPHMGWEAVSALLMQAADTPVVCSYSVCDAFPNPWLCGATTEEQREAWYALPRDRQWEQAWAGLHTQERWNGLSIEPHHWTDYAFGHGLTWLDVVAEDAP